MSKINFIPAICPSCGGELRVPDSMGVVKCMYCGKDIIIQITQEETKLSVNIKALLDLAKTAEELENYNEAEKYYTQALEYDSDNIYAWLGRGYCAGMLSSPVTIHKIVEALTYLDKVFLGNMGKDETFTQLLGKMPNEYISLAKKHLTRIYNHWTICCWYNPPRRVGEINTYEEREKRRDEGLRFTMLLYILDWLYVLSKEDPDEQKKIKRGIVSFVNTVYICAHTVCILSSSDWDEEQERLYIKGCLLKSKLNDDPDIWAEVDKSKEEKNQIKPTSTKKKRWWS
jgi:tetratricopeptide (TPR) repeat protein